MKYFPHCGETLLAHEIIYIPHVFKYTRPISNLSVDNIGFFLQKDKFSLLVDCDSVYGIDAFT